MALDPKLLRIASRGGLVAAMVFSLLWVTSIAFGAVWIEPGGRILRVTSGVFHVEYVSDPITFAAKTASAKMPTGGFNVAYLGWHVKWWFLFYNTPPFFIVQVPLWIPALGAALIALLPWFVQVRGRRRERHLRCSRCNYDRTGLCLTAGCPECGKRPGQEFSRLFPTYGVLLLTWHAVST